MEVDYKNALKMIGFVAVGALATLGIGWITSTKWITDVKPEWLTGFATLVLGIVTIFLFLATRDLAQTTADLAQTTATAFQSESQHNRFALALDLLLKLDDRFNEMRSSRRNAANYCRVYLREKQAGRKPPVEGSAYLDEVLDFFDLLGYFLKLRALDRLPVWNMFYHQAHHWYSAAEEYITSHRQDEHTIWENFDALNKGLVAEQMAQRKCMDIDASIRLSRADLGHFLDNESG